MRPRCAPLAVLLTTTLLALAWAGAPACADQKSFTVAGRTITFDVDLDHLLVSAPVGAGLAEVRASAANVARRAITAQSGVTHESPDAYLKDLLSRPNAVTIPGALGTLVQRLRSFQPGMLKGNAPGSLTQILNADVRTVYKTRNRNGTTSLVIPQRSVTVRFKAPPAADTLAAIQQAYRLSAPEKRSYLPDTYTFHLQTPASAVDPLSDEFTVQSRLQQKYASQVMWVEPDLAFQVKLSDVPDDSLFKDQWYLSDPPSGLRLPKVWDIVRGLPRVRIAVIDTGIDLAHEDLMGVFVDPLDATVAAGAPGRDNPAPQGNEAHGTHCVGIAAAITGNKKGIAGIASGCRIIPIRAYIGQAIAGQAATRLEYVVEALHHAKAKGAKVISLSAEFPDFTEAMSRINQVIDEITRDDTCLIVAAAGNNIPSANVVYPANHPRCMAVGAVGRDNGRLIYSNFTQGQNVISIMAPSGLLEALGEIVTTDPTGPAGDNPGGEAADSGGLGDRAGNYFYKFDGTSAATPMVAATAALIWSARPELKASEVREILEKTAEPVHADQVVYTSGRNDEYGFGKLNPLAAVCRAMGLPTPPAATPAGPIAMAAAAPPSAVRPPADAPRAEKQVATLFDPPKPETTHTGESHPAYSSPHWATLVLPGAADEATKNKLISEAVKPDWLDAIAKVKPYKVGDKEVLMIQRMALRSRDELLKTARGGGLPDLHPVVEQNGNWHLPLGTLSVDVKHDDLIEAAKQRLARAGLKVVGENGRHLTLKLGDQSPFRSVFEASKLLGKEKDLFATAYTDFLEPRRFP